MYRQHPFKAKITDVPVALSQAELIDITVALSKIIIVPVALLKIIIVPVALFEVLKGHCMLF